jgi:hypothetical protein
MFRWKHAMETESFEYGIKFAFFFHFYLFVESQVLIAQGLTAIYIAVI